MRDQTRHNFPIIALFLLLTLVPFLVTVIEQTTSVSFQLSESTENRVLAERPALDAGKTLKTYTSEFDDFYQDRFGLRDVLLRIWQRLNILLGKSPTDKVLIGREGWLFYTQDDVISKHTGEQRLTTEQLETERLFLEAKRDWLQSLGIHYLYVVTPDKHSIYPEYLPASVSTNDIETPLDQFVSYMRTYSDVGILDMRPALLEAKQAHRVYHRTDTHWNQLGAYFGANSIVQNLSIELETGQLPPLDDQEILRQIGPGGDLAIAMGFPHIYEEDRPVLINPSASCQPVENRWQAFADAHQVELKSSICPHVPDIKLLYLGDSFQLDLLPHLQKAFRRTDPMTARFSPQLVAAYLAKHQPDLVIEQSVERQIMKSSLIDELINLHLPAVFDQYPLLNQLSLSNPDGLISLTNNLVITPQEDGLQLNVGPVQSFALLQWEPPAQSQGVAIRIRLQSPADTILAMYYRKTSNRYRDNPPKIVEIRSGLNDIYIKIEDVELLGPVRLDPARVPGDYRIEAIEIRNLIPLSN